ncbi:hypothetical protein BASA81_000081 [Batrachochytrium salamandrivorans]|nr:hypothetical protein BASA81_000081 [Batrachochytrium salamandrivorans]
MEPTRRSPSLTRANTNLLSLDTDLIPAVSLQSQLVSSVHLPLSAIGPARKASTHSALQAATAALALVRENDTPSPPLGEFRSALFAAQATRQTVLIAYSDGILDRAVGGGDDAHSVALLDLARNELLHIRQDLEWEGSVGLLKTIVYVAASTHSSGGNGGLVDGGEEEFAQMKVDLPQLDLVQIRQALTEIQTVWTNCRSLSFREACILALQSSHQFDLQANHHPALVCALLGTGFNLARRQVVGSTKVRLMVTIVLNGELDVETRSACFSAATAMDDLWSRFRNPKPNAVATSPSHNAIGNRLTEYADRLPREPWVMEMALGLSQVAARINSPHALPEANPNLLQVFTYIAKLRGEGTSLSPVALVWQALQVQPQFPRRLFNDWTSEGEGDSSGGDEDDDTFSQSEVSNPRLEEIRMLVARYGMFQTTHPDDRLVLANPEPISLRRWVPDDYSDDDDDDDDDDEDDNEDDEDDDDEEEDE